MNNFENRIDPEFTWINNFMASPLNLIHYLEFVLHSCDEFLRFQGIITSSSYFSAIKSTKKFSSNKSDSNFNNLNNHVTKHIKTCLNGNKSPSGHQNVPIW